MTGMYKKISLSIQQPVLATYRQTLFEQLGQLYNLKLYYSCGEIPSCLPNNSKLYHSELIKFRIMKWFVKWHIGQIKAVNKDVNVIILSWDIQYVTLWLALLKAKILNKPVILWGHGYSKNENSFKKKLRDLPILMAKAILLYDYNTAQKYKITPHFKKKVFVAPNSLDHKKICQAKYYWNSNSKDFEKFLEDKDLSKYTNIIYVGRIYPDNKLELLFKALEYLKSEISNIKLIIIGSGGSYEQKLKLLGYELGLQDNIKWCGAIYDELQIAPYMLASKVFCYPRNIGLSLIHAFGYGLPVVTDNNLKSHNPEIWALEDTLNGMLYKTGNTVDFSAKIKLILKNPELQKNQSKAALSTVRERFNLDKMSEGIKSAIAYSVS